MPRKFGSTRYEVSIKTVLLPENDQVFCSVGPTGPVIKKRAADLMIGEFLWCFLADTLTPVVQGRFEFTPITGAPTRLAVPCYSARWFDKSNGPEIAVPVDWRLFGNEGARSIADTSLHRAFAFPSFLHDPIPYGIDFQLFSSGLSVDYLTEEVAYFLGAFALRPQAYTVGSDTWGVTSVGFNRAGEFGFAPSRVPLFKAWYINHLTAMSTLADRVWGAGNYFVEQKCSAIGMPDVPVPAGHQPSRFIDASAVPIGFAIHGPIAKGAQLSTRGQANDDDMRLIQYWYACLESNLCERATVSVRKAFLLGAADTISNADSTRKSLGLDWPDGFVGEFPFYSIVHSVGRSLLATFQSQETSNPRADPKRDRGRIPRCSLEEYVREIGFISQLRFSRSIKYEAALAGQPLAAFPTPNVLSVVFGTPVSTIGLFGSYGSDERDLSNFKLFVQREVKDVPFIAIQLQEDGAFPASSLPLGTSGSNLPAISSKAVSKVRLAKVSWERDGLEKLVSLNNLLPKIPSAPAEDQIFEYLIALMLSRLEGAAEAWVVPRSEDQGIDGGALYDLGPTLGRVSVVFQAKLQGKAVGRRIVDQVRGSLFREDAAIGYVVTNANFTYPARKSATMDYPRVRMIDGTSLMHDLVRHKLGFFSVKTGTAYVTYIDLTFFEILRQTVIDSRGRTGRVKVKLNSLGMPQLVSP